MASINGNLRTHFAIDQELGSVVDDLDTGIYVAGLSIQNIRDMVLHGNSGSSSCDTEVVAAATETLLAYLCHLGRIVDRLQELAGRTPDRVDP